MRQRHATIILVALAAASVPPSPDLPTGCSVVDVVAVPTHLRPPPQRWCRGWGLARLAAAQHHGSTAAAMPGGVGSRAEVEQLEQRAAALRASLSARGDGTAASSSHAALLATMDQQLQLATILQRLNHLKPDGGSRVREAEQLYRAVLRGTGWRADGGAGGAAPLPAAALLEAGARVMSNLAALLLEAERTEEALELLEELLGDKDTAGQRQQAVPLDILCGLRFNRAKALGAIGRLQEAQSAYEHTARGAEGEDAACFAKAVAAIEALPDDLLASLQVVLRRLQEAQQDGRSSGANTARSASLGSWLAGVEPRDHSWMEFAAYKALDSRGEYGEAWAHLEQANRLMAPLVGYQPQHDAQQLATIVGVFRQPLLQQLAQGGTDAARSAGGPPAAHAPPAAPAQQQPAADLAGGDGDGDVSAIFIVGLPRSGSTLLETMLSSHPAGVWAAGEDTALAPMTTEVNARLAGGGATPQELAAFGRRYLHEMARRAAASGWPADRPLRFIVDKMLRNLWLVGYIELLLPPPSSCVVHVVRHPLDAGLSCYAQPFGYQGVPWAWDLEHIGQQIKLTHKIARHWDEQLPGRVLTLRYEEVVTDPASSLRALLLHCGLSAQPELVDSLVKGFHNAKRTVATASAAQVRKPLYTGSMGRWQRYEAHLQPLVQQVRQEVQQYEEALQRRRQGQLAKDSNGGGLEGASGAGSRSPAAAAGHRRHDAAEL